MESVKEQRIGVQFHFQAGKTAIKTHNILCEAYNNYASSETMIYKWFKCFKNGRTSTDDDERSGQLQDPNL
jgi:hypothetical protein